MTAVYLLHFDRPFGHARHYLGFARNLDARLAAHAAGQGARLTQVVKAAGIGWSLARTWPGASRTDERRLKGRGGRRRLCPVCQAARPGSGPGCSGCSEGNKKGLGGQSRPWRKAPAGWPAKAPAGDPILRQPVNR